MNIPFRTIYRIFLFRVVDTDLLSPGGDITRLIGQIAVIPILLGIGFTFGTMGLGGVRGPRSEMLIAAWGLEHALIATTILLTGLFSILSWESAYPDFKDVMVLGTLPVTPQTLYLAKIAALGSAQATVVAALCVLPALTWPLAMAPPSRSLLDLVFMPEVVQTFFAFWITMFGAGAFSVFSVTAMQGVLAHVMPRYRYLQVSAWLQLLFFCGLLAAYFVQPVAPNVTALAHPANRTILQWSPSYWFLGLFQFLNGSMHPVMRPLLELAVFGLCTVAALSFLTNGLWYRRRLRQIVEQPELQPSSARGAWTPKLGEGAGNAIFQFIYRTLSRGRQHRLLLALYVGVALSTVILLIKTGAGRGVLSPLQQARTSLASVLVVTAWVLGLRAVAGLPVSLKANWIFRITQLRPAQYYYLAARRSLQAVALVPSIALAPIMFFSLWPWQQALIHLVALSLWCIAITNFALLSNRSIPFTCSLRPGSSAMHLRLLVAVGAIVALGKATAYEQRALQSLHDSGLMLTALGLLALASRFTLLNRHFEDSSIVEFEDIEPPAIQSLGLPRDALGN
jgi:hypothetical protein